MSEPVVLREFTSRSDADVVRELLEANEIEAFISSDDCGSVDPALSFARGVKLMVAAEDVERAETAIAEGLANADADGTDLDTNP